MGKKGSWISSVKKAFSPESKKRNRSNKKSLEKEEPIQVQDSSVLEAPIASQPPTEEVKSSEAEEEREETQHNYSVVATAQDAAEVVRLTTVPSQFAGKSKEETAAIRIQTAFRGYLARRALRALRGLVRLKSLIHGSSVERQTANALKCMQTLSHVQSQILSRRNRLLEENRALQRQLLQKHAKELESLRRGEEWDDSLQSKEKIEANLLSKCEAAMRRERALAYSYSHQQTWKKSSRSPNLLFMDPTNPQWGWSWLDRWMGTSEKESKNDQISSKGTNFTIGEITRSFARHQLNSEQPSSPASQKPIHSKPQPSARKPKSPSPRVLSNTRDDNDDARSVFSVKSERNRRHSIETLSVRDNESLASSTSVPSYMAPTRSAKARTSLPNPCDSENGAPGKAGVGPANKRLSFSPSPATRPRRHSAPPKPENISIAHPISNGEFN